MVKFRGIDVSIISQFDIRKLPEFSPCESNNPFQQEGPALRSGDNSVASCYVPVYPGSQIWFEYSIDGPHPPDASYFFKMLHNGQVVTSWDCTAKQRYHGKMTYNIQYISNDNLTGMPLVQRQAFKFTLSDSRKDLDPLGDCIEIRVHRIEHCQRVPLDSSTNDSQLVENGATGRLCLVNGGLLEPGCPQHRYRYQLLDPTDEPYATIRFYYRSYGFLKDQNVIPPLAKPSRSNSTSSSGDWSERSNSDTQGRGTDRQEAAHPQRGSPRRAPSASVTPPPTCGFQITKDSQQKANSESEKKALIEHCPPPRNSGESLRIVAKDDLEDLHASPLHVKHDSPLPVTDDVKTVWNDNIESTSPKKLQKKLLTLNIDGADFKHEKKRRRPLSPFTSAGVLRRMMSPTAPSAPAAVTEFLPTVAEDVEAQLARENERRKLEKAQVTTVGTTRAERGSKMLLGFFGKRIGRVN